MSRVDIDELNPETRARVLAQISGTESDTAALATVEPPALRPRIKNPRSEDGQSTRRESEREFCYIPFAELLPHPLNKRLYGSEEVDPKLLASIQQHGILEPLLIARLSFDGANYANYIVSGHRRWTAAMWVVAETNEKKPVIPVRWLNLNGLRGSTELLEIDHLQVERLIIESNRQRAKTPEQLAREFTELKRIESELAKRRQGTRTDIVANLPPSSTGKARDKAAAAVGLSGRTAQKLEKVVRAADAGDAGARAELNALNSGESKSIDAAYKAVVAPKPPRNPELIAAIQAHEKAARDLQSLLKTKGIDAEVNRSKSDGKFHVIWRDVTAEQVRKFAEAFKI
jgi:hypothetical protein